MPPSSTTEICMVVWPVSAGEQVLDPNDSIAWVVGWNDRSLYIIVAWFLRNCTLREADLELQSIRTTLRSYHGPHTGMPYDSLTILGCVRPNSVSCFNRVSMSEEEDIRRTRKDSFIWLELLEGPVLGELWCCGARVQPCQLHVVRCDLSRGHSIRPTRFSATSLYGVAGLRQLRGGVAPVCAPGAASSLEGVLLPLVMRKEAEPRLPRRPQSRRHNAKPMNDSIVLATEDSFITADLEGPSTAGCSKWSANARMDTSLATNPSNNGSFAKNASAATECFRPISAPAGDTPAMESGDRGTAAAPSERESAAPRSTLELQEAAAMSDSEADHLRSSGHLKEQQPHTHAAKFCAMSSTAPRLPPPAGVPPRLDFPSTSDKAEMSVFLATMRAGSNVRSVIQKEKPRNYVDGSMVVPLTGFTKFAVTFLFPYVGRLLRLLRFSRTAEVLLYRISEFTHFLSVMSCANHSCGLHPALPHQVSPLPSRRSVCLLNYVTRCAVDLALGVLVYLCVSAWGPSLYLASQYVTRHWLYEVHASYMDWFDGYPAGLKVNEDLNMALCFFAKCVLQLWDGLLSWSPATLPSLMAFQTSAASVPAPASASGWSYPGSEEQLQVIYDWVGTAFHLRIFCFLGCSTAAAFVSDLTRLVSLHLRFLYHAIAFLYRVARVLLINLFRQFNGVKFNPLRKRYDVYHFETDQMLTATFLFVIAAFLFPTLAVYYLYFSFVLATIWAMETILESIAYLAMHVPLFPICYWLMNRQELSGGVALSRPVITSVHHVQGRHVRQEREKQEEKELASHTVEVAVEAVPLPLIAMLTDFFVVLDVLLARLNPAKMVSLVVLGRIGETPYMTDVMAPHLLTDCVSPRCTLCLPPSNPNEAKKH